MSQQLSHHVAGRRPVAAISLVAALACTMPSIAHAVVLPPPTYWAQVGVTGHEDDHRGNTSQQASAQLSGEGRLSWGSAFASGDDNGTARAFAYWDDIGVPGSVSSSALVSYSFQLLPLPGTTPATAVPVEVKADAVHSRPGSYASGEASFSLQQQGVLGSLIYAQDYTYPLRSTIQIWGVDRTVMLIPDAVYTVEIAASVLAYYDRDIYGGVVPMGDEVVVDPQFLIDPAFASQYQFYGLPGGASVLAAPEPATWALLLAGLGVMGMMGSLRRRAMRVSLWS